MCGWLVLRNWISRKVCLSGLNLPLARDYQSQEPWYVLYCPNGMRCVYVIHIQSGLLVVNLLPTIPFLSSLKTSWVYYVYILFKYIFYVIYSNTTGSLNFSIYPQWTMKTWIKILSFRQWIQILGALVDRTNL